MNTQPVTDATDSRPLYKPLGLYLKPISKLHITVTLPQIKVEGLTVSNWALMEKVKQVAGSVKFISMRVKLSTVDFVRFEAELEHSSHIEKATAALDNQSIKIGGFTAPFKVKAKKASTDFPTKAQWEAHFMDNEEHYDENQPGERADTIYFKEVPKRFFADEGTLNPTEENIRLAFLTFGQIRNMDVPMLNPDYAEEASLSATALVAAGKEDQATNAFSMTGTGLNFEFYVQFMDRIGFERCMDEFRDMKLMHVDDTGKAVAATLKVQFDKSKHLSEGKMLQRAEIRKQAAIEKEQREKLRVQKRQEEERKLAEQERVKAAKDKQKEQRRLQRQNKRRERRIKVKHKKEEKKLKRKIQMEERKLILAQRKLEASRILEKLFDRVAKMKEMELAKKLEAELEAEKKRQEEKDRRRKEREDKDKAREEQKKANLELERKEKELKEKLLKQVGDRRRAKEAAEKAKRETENGKDSSRRDRDEERKRKDKKEKRRREEEKSNDRKDEKRSRRDEKTSRSDRRSREEERGSRRERR